MSWILAAEGKLNTEEKMLLRRLAPEPLFTFEDETIFILAGGLKTTCICGASSSAEKGWIICGTGITTGADSARIISMNEWEHYLGGSTLDLESAEGQYAGIHWQDGKIEGFVDSIGLRDMYSFFGTGYKILSTRLDWVSALQKDRRINFRRFGSRWLTFTQLSRESLLRGVERIKPIKPFEFPEGVSSEKNFIECLERLTYLPQSEGKRALLGISGGLDSRLLLALYSKSKFEDVDLFTFGSDHPDVLISKKICEKLHLEQQIIDEAVKEDADFYVREISEFQRHINCGRKSSAYLYLRYYQKLKSNNSIIIDGAFGELARRQFLNRLLLKGRKSLLARDAEGIFRQLKVFRGDFFSEEIKREIEEGAKEDIQSLIATLPDITRIGPENWLDLFAIHAIVPNVVGYEQSRMDHYVQSFMPFVQPSLLRESLRLPLAQRRNGKLFRRLITENCPVLTKFPLVRNNISYPYSFTTIPSYLLMKIKQKFGMAYHDPSGEELLIVLKEFILDRVYSEGCKSSPYYNHKKVASLAEGFYSGNAALASELDWWLAFELWRSNVEAFQP